MGKDVRKTILVVDDAPLNRRILSDVLKRDYDILEASNGQEAFTVLDANHGQVEAIMLDLVMPVMNGYEFMELLIEREEYQHIPVIMLTGSGDRENERKALQLGAWDFITKPFDGDIIKFRLKHVLERSRMAEYKQLKYDAECDALTGLYNKANFLRNTEKLLSEHEQEKFALVRFDVDRFSVINSYYGMPEGDLILKKVADCLRECGERASLFTCGRIGADEFAFCMDYEKQDDIIVMIKEINQRSSFFDISFRIVLSFGIYPIDDRSIPVEMMLDHARIAGKKAKGKFINNYCFYNVEMRKILEREQRIVNEMTRALEEEQFEIYLQPKYNLKTNKSEGAEALTRWVHPEKGLVSPGYFIPVFEHNGFIEKLDYYVLEKVCILLKNWIGRGITPCPISVNLSRVNIYNPRIVELINGLTARYGVPNELLQIELTESAYTDRQSLILETVDKLHEYGFRVLMDDFGSGYSSLNTLKDIDVDILKIDMGFFTGGKRPGRGESIIASVVRMAKWLNIPVIAEGVEKLEQVRFLREIGCEYVQGYYFAKPMQVSEYEMLVERDEVFVPERKEGFNLDRMWETTPEMEQLFSSVLQAVCIYEIEEGNPEHIERVRVNNAFYELFGYEDMAHFSKNPVYTLKEEFRKPFLDLIESVIEQVDVGEMECERTCANGKELWIHVKMKYVHQVGNYHVIMCSFFDVTEQREIDMELQKYRAVLAKGKKKTNRMLIVDDIEFNRDILRDMFEDQYEVLMAENGLQALDILVKYENNVDLILLDMIMPVMNGTQFLEYKRKHGEIAAIPVIIITSDDSPKQQVNTLALGANDYITKPFVPETVKRRVDNVMESQLRFKEVLRQHSSELQKMQMDALTELYSKESAKKIIDDLLYSESDRMHAMMLVDLNNFRSLNEQYGSGAGDRVLQSIAGILRRYFRSNDIIARIRDDMFCVFMTAVPSREMVVKKCSQLSEKISQIEVEGVVWSFRVSVGVTVTEKDDKTYDTVFENAQKALTKAKESGDGATALFP